MALEVLTTILQAEKLATQTVADAERSASEAVKNAEATVREQERQAAVANRALYQQMIDDKRISIAREMEAQKESRKKVIQERVLQAQSRLQEAVSMIINEVLDGHR